MKKISFTGDDNISISSVGDNYGISYKDDQGNIINVTNESSKFRSVHCSELYENLKDRDWNITERRYVNNSEELMIKILKGSSDVDSISVDSSNIGIKACNLNGISEDDKESFRTEYENILSDMKNNEIYLYSSIKKMIDLMDNTIVIELVRPEFYTNSLNLEELIKKNYGNFAKIDISIQYTKNEKVFNFCTSFNGIPIVNFMENINKDLALEVINGVIRIIPKSSKIKECIISNCTVTYGNVE